MKRAVILLSVFVLISCEPVPETTQRMISGQAQGSTYSIVYLEKNHTPQQLKASVDSILEVIDASMSLWRDGSNINRLNLGDSAAGAEPHMVEVVKQSIEAHKYTQGALDVTLAPVIKFWGFNRDAPQRPDSAKVDSLLNFTGIDKIVLKNNHVYLKPGAAIDLNAIAQGYTVDVIARFFDTRGIENYMIEVGGEIKTRGRNVEGEIWRIGIDKPSEEIEVDRFQAIVNLDGKGLATSGNYRKFWTDTLTGAKYSHTINPKTGFPERNLLLSATVIAPTAAQADALSTACMVLGLERAKALVNQIPEVDAFFIYSGEEGEWLEWHTEGFAKMRK